MASPAPLSLVFGCPFVEPATAFGGPVESLRQTCARLAARGHRVRVVATALGVPPDLPRDEWVARPGGYDVWYAPTNALTPYAPHFAPAVRRGLAAALAPGSLLLLNVGFTHLNTVARPLAQARGIPYLLTPRGVYGQHHVRRRRISKCLFKMVFERRLVRDAALIQALVPEEAEDIRQFGAAAARIRIVPNGVDLADVAARAGGRSLAALGGFPPAAPAVLFLSRLNASKGLDLLIPAFAACCAAVPEPWYLVLAGPDDGELPRARALAAAAGVADRVVFPGPLWGADKYQALADAAIFALTSYAEGLPVAVLEACAAACPVLVTDRCHLPDIATRDAGRVCAPDVREIERGLLELMRCPTRERLGANARRLVEERYAWPRVVDQLEALCREALATAGTR